MSMNNIPRIMLVDDDEDTLMIINHKLKKLNVEIVSLSKSQVALEEYVRRTEIGETFQLIALDIRMPELDGYQLSKKIREKGYQGLIIALTASKAQDSTEKFKEHGFDRHIEKKNITKESITELLTIDLKSKP